MEYMVIGADGAEYGPATVDTLRGWAADSRLLPNTMLKNVQSGQTQTAASVSGIFPPASGSSPAAAPPRDWSQPPSADYPRGTNPGGKPVKVDDGKWDLIWAIARSAVALIFFFVLQGLGVIVAIYAIVYAFRAKEKGHQHANIGIIISVLTLVIIGIGWLLRLSAMAH